MANMKYYDETLQQWVILDAKDADTVDGKHANELVTQTDFDNHNHDGVYEKVLTEDQKRKVMVSNADPSGGSDGDIWLKYE